MIACAADEIIADPHSIVGSIGVVGGSFGFDKLIAKFGVERRLYTSGEHKAMLDPFLPEDPADVERLKKLQREIHDDFIALVKSRRGDKLNGPENDLFSGEYWTGRRAVCSSALSMRSAICAVCCASASVRRWLRPWSAPNAACSGGASGASAAAG